MGKNLIGASSKRALEVKADGAYNTKDIRRSIEERGGSLWGLIQQDLLQKQHLLA